jgi:signal transduction histidine kinase
LDKRRAISIALVKAEERERHALTHDLQDDLAQMLAVLALKVSVIHRSNADPKLQAAIDDCTKVVDQVNVKLRSMALQLAPPILAHCGFVSALHWLADEVRRAYGLSVQIRSEGALDGMDPVVHMILLRAVRELMLNVHRHARAATATIATAVDAHGTVTVTVCDDGVGLDHDLIASSVEDVGYGLLGIRERLGFLGGHMSILSRAGRGTTVTLRVPSVVPGRVASKPDTTVWHL